MALTRLDVSTQISGNVAATNLSNTSVIPNTYGYSNNTGTQMAVVTFDQQGRAISATNTSILAANSTMLLFANTINTPITIANNALSVGPLNLSNGVLVTMNPGTRWVIL
jgi:hypothetical protein